MSTTSARNPGIDLLRGISILLVMLNHIGIRIRLMKGILAAVLPKQVLIDITFNGGEGVIIFFVISGFLIATNSMHVGVVWAESTHGLSISGAHHAYFHAWLD